MMLELSSFSWKYAAVGSIAGAAFSGLFHAKENQETMPNLIQKCASFAMKLFLSIAIVSTIYGNEVIAIPLIISATYYSAKKDESKIIDLLGLKPVIPRPGLNHYQRILCLIGIFLCIAKLCWKWSKLEYDQILQDIPLGLLIGAGFSELLYLEADWNKSITQEATVQKYYSLAQQFFLGMAVSSSIVLGRRRYWWMTCVPSLAYSLYKKRSKEKEFINNDTVKSLCKKGLDEINEEFKDQSETVKSTRGVEALRALDGKLIDIKLSIKHQFDADKAHYSKQLMMLAIGILCCTPKVLVNSFTTKVGGEFLDFYD